MNAAGAMALTGLVLLVAFAVYGVWTAEGRYKYSLRSKHRAGVTTLGVLSGVAFIAAIWMGVA